MHSYENCGNSMLDTEECEACDDGDNVSDDGCNTTCTSDEICGNGIVDSMANEQCDDGNSVPGDGCSAMCKLYLDPGAYEPESLAGQRLLAHEMVHVALVWKTIRKSELKGQRTEDLPIDLLHEIVPPHVHITLLADRGFAAAERFVHLTTLGVGLCYSISPKYIGAVW